MAYTPNPNREVRNGKAMVSAKELADFQAQYGADKTLRDLLNMDKGLQRRVTIPKSMRNLPQNEPDPNIGSKVNNLVDTFKIPVRSSSENPDATSKKTQVRNSPENPDATSETFKRGGSVRSASSRADGIATKGKTRGKIVMCGGGMYKK